MVSLLELDKVGMSFSVPITPDLAQFQATLFNFHTIDDFVSSFLVGLVVASHSMGSTKWLSKFNPTLVFLPTCVCYLIKRKDLNDEIRA